MSLMQCLVIDPLVPAANSAPSPLLENICPIREESSKFSCSSFPNKPEPGLRDKELLRLR